MVCVVGRSVKDSRQRELYWETTLFDNRYRVYGKELQEELLVSNFRRNIYSQV